MMALLVVLAATLATIAGAAQPVVELASDRPSHDLAPFLEYLEDPAHAIGIADARSPQNAARYRSVPSTSELNFGYSRSAYWLRFTVTTPPADTRERLLEIAFPSLDRIEVYVPDGRGGYTEQIGGDLMPYAERAYPHRNFVFPLQLPPGATQIIYLRVESQGSLTIPATLWDAEAFHEHDRHSYALLSVYFGMLLALLLYNLLLYLSLRERVFLTYVCFVASMAVAQASFYGLANQFAWPNWPVWGNVALPSGMSATGFFGALFTREFLDTRRTAPTLDRLILFMAGVFTFSAFSPLALSYQFAAIFTSLTGLVFAIVATAGGMICMYRGHPGARYLLLAWALLLVGVGVLALRNLNWVPTNWFTTYAMFIGSALEMLLLSFALADRINVMRREKEKAQDEALRAQRNMVSVLQRSEQELEGRVEERTRALAIANAQLMENERQLQRMAHQDPLTGLANRILLCERIEHALARSRRRGQPVAVLLIDLDGFKPVNDQYGHAVGDQLLIAVASRLRAAVRNADTVARLGGDEFVIVLDELREADCAAKVADELVNALSQPFEVNGRVLRVTASVGVALHPAHGADPQSLIKRADEAMYRAKHGGRNGSRVAAQPPVRAVSGACGHHPAQSPG